MRITDKLLITPKDIEPSFSEWKVQGVFNPAAVRLPDGKILLMARVAEAHLHNEKVIHCPMITDSGFTSEAIPMKRVRKRTKTHVYLRNGVCRLTTFSHFRQQISNSREWPPRADLNLSFFSGEMFFFINQLSECFCRIFYANLYA